MSENQAVWKSNKQGFKEATFIQMGRRSGDTKMNGEVERHREVQRHRMGVPTFMYAE